MVPAESLSEKGGAAIWADAQSRSPAQRIGEALIRTSSNLERLAMSRFFWVAPMPVAHDE